MPLPDRHTRERALAETYSTRSSASVWELVEQYRQVQEYVADHPNAGSTAVARALELPRSRVRPWPDDGMPDAVRAIETAARKGWLDAAPGDRPWAGLTIMHAWIVGGGAITARNWRPRFAVGDDDPEAALRAAARAVDVQVAEQHTDAVGRGRELAVTTHGAVLGRYLGGVLDVPVGPKAGGDQSLPQWLTAAPFDTQLRWARTYVSLRGTTVPEGHGYRLQLKEEGRPAAWFRQVAALSRELIGDPNKHRDGLVDCAVARPNGGDAGCSPVTPRLKKVQSGPPLDGQSSTPLSTPARAS
ncbi:hypothetical protein [Halosegnis sp.]|uniref:hypothetical protein n=1 Tax=Halosegnis sp. TaxID=2864959 RepID=UPI0035D4C727